MKVFVTGIGAITPLADNYKETYELLLQGKSALGMIENPERYRYQKTSQIRYPISWNKNQKKCRAEAFLEKAIIDAIKDAKLDDEIHKSETLISVGTMFSSNTDMEEKYFLKESSFSTYSTGDLINTIANRLNLSGPRITISTACSSGATAIGAAYRQICNGRADIAICGGVDAFRVLAHCCMSSLRIIDPECVKAFATDRNGTILGEGAGILILESEKRIQKRHVYAQISGFGCSCDAESVSLPDSDGMSRAIKKAIKGLSINGSIYINAHGTGTIANDKPELDAISKIFMNHLNDIYVSSSKGAIGHTVGAAGAIEAIIAILALNHNYLPPNINVKNYEKIANINIIKEYAIEQNVEYSISNSFGFGGNNSAIIFRRMNHG